jgi:hypothetical protein
MLPPMAMTATQTTAHTATSRSALALGMVGALGEELLSMLVGSSDYRAVHVAVTQPIGSATARFAPWIPGHGVVAADDAFVCIAAPDALVPKGSPMQRVDADAVLAAGRTARQCGASRLVVVSPLSALLQLNAAAHTLANEAEVELAALGFETLIIVRPAAEGSAVVRGCLPGAVRALTRLALEIMLPPSVQPLRARTAAAAIIEAVRRTGRGVHVLGARELAQIVAETMPGAVPRRVRLR